MLGIVHGFRILSLLQVQYRFGASEKKQIPSSLTLLWYDLQIRPGDSIDPHIETPQPTLHEYHNRATAAARPPSTPAPKPATFCGPEFFVADAAAEDVLELAWLETLAAAEETEEEADEDALDTEEEVLLPAEETLEVTGAAEAVEEAVEVQETAVGRFVTPEILQKFCAYEVAAS